MSSRPMNRSVQPAPTEKEPAAGFGIDSDGVQGAWRFEPRSFLAWQDIVYGALQRAVGDHYDKQHLFAEAIGVSSGEASRRLKHAPDEKTGRPQSAYLDYLATIALQPGALEQFCADLMREKGCRIEQDRPLTAEEKVEIYRSLTSDKARRNEEKVRGLPAGALD